MMRKAVMAAAVLALCANTGAASAQGFGVGAHVGTTGVGGDVAISLNNMFSLHGSLGTYPVKPTMTFSDLKFELDPPKTVMTLGAELFPGAGSFHLMGGILTGFKDIGLTTTYTGSVTIGDSTYNGAQLGTIVGNYGSESNIAPFVGLGIGRHTGTGIGLTLDLGVAFLSKQTLSLDAPDTTLPAQGQARFEADLEKERARVEDDIKKYTKLLPMLNIGIRIGL